MTAVGTDFGATFCFDLELSPSPSSEQPGTSGRGRQDYGGTEVEHDNENINYDLN